MERRREKRKEERQKEEEKGDELLLPVQIVDPPLDVGDATELSLAASFDGK